MTIGRVESKENDSPLVKCVKEEKKSHFNFFSSPKGNFDREKYRARLSQGQVTSQTDEKLKCIYIKTLFSHKQGSGFGTAAIRSMVEESIKLKYEGNLQLESAWQSYLFYLYMGMIPLESRIPYIDHWFGYAGGDALEALNKCHDEADLLKVDADEIATMKRMLRLELDIPIKSATLQDILKNRDLLLDLNKKTCSYIEAKFIPNLLKLLEKNYGNKYPNSTDFAAVQMKFSSEGKARWIDAIKNNKEFVPFKDLSHLRSFISNKEVQEHFDHVASEYQKSLVSVTAELKR